MLYGILAIAGLLGPWYFNVEYIAAGANLGAIPGALGLAFANPITSSLSVDLLIAFAAFAIWAVAEARRTGIRAGWLYPLLGFFIAFAFAYPLFLLVRERRIAVGHIP